MLPSMTPPRGAGRRLSVDDWIQAGFALLADGGPNALARRPLCERLGVTKGSFYWHFADLPAYRTALIEAWGSLQDQDRQRFENSPDVEPRERLEVHDAGGDGAPAVGAGTRDAGVGADRRNRRGEAYEEATGGCCGAVHQAFVDAGFDDEDAAGSSGRRSSRRAWAFCTASTPNVAPAEVQDRFLDFMLRP